MSAGLKRIHTGLRARQATLIDRLHHCMIDRQSVPRGSLKVAILLSWDLGPSS